MVHILETLLRILGHALVIAAPGMVDIIYCTKNTINYLVHQ